MAGVAIAAAAAFVSATAATAQTPIGTLYASPDVATQIGGMVFVDEDVVRDDPSTGISRVPLGSLPRDADLEAYHLEASGEHLLVFDTAVELPGGLAVEARDVVHYDGASYGVVFDGSLHGVPVDVGIDALTRSAGGDLVLSFDATVGSAADEDLVRFDGVSFSPYFDGSSVAVPGERDLDAAHRLSNDHLLLSFDTAGSLAGVDYADEDLLEFDPATGSWFLAFDASAAAYPWPATTDLDAIAVPEPSFELQLALGGLFVAFAARRRARQG